MPRKHRIGGKDGLYHVINKGNYRGLVFESEGATRAFATCLDQACERFGWEVHTRDGFYSTRAKPK